MGKKISNLFDEYYSAGYWGNQVMRKKKKKQQRLWVIYLKI